jgi:hypothetical protein
MFPLDVGSTEQDQAFLAGRSGVELPAEPAELSDADLEVIVAGKEGSFGRKVLWAIASSFGTGDSGDIPFIDGSE